MAVIVSSSKWEFALFYLDDVMIFSRTASEHIVHVCKAFRLLRHAGVSLKLPECSFFTDRLDYLGQVALPERLAVSGRTRKVIEGLCIPINVSEFRSFLGLCNVYRQFVQSVSQIVGSINQVVAEGTTVPVWRLNTQRRRGIKHPKPKAHHGASVGLAASQGSFYR